MPIPSGYVLGRGGVAMPPEQAALNQAPAMQNLSGRTFDTGIPGFENLSKSASGNVGNLLSGTESPDITRNINAQWGAGSGMGGGSEFMRNRGADLYGQRSEARKAQGLQSLLGMLQGYSGTVVAKPGDILGNETSRYGIDTGANTAREGFANQFAIANANNASNQAINAANIGQRNTEFGFTFPEQQRQYDISSRNQNNQFNANLGQNYMNSYMNFLK